jgi:NADH-quinone oxidoreductase subunit L
LYTHATGVFHATWLLVALPLAGAAISLIGGKRLDKVGHIIGTLAALASFVVAVVLFFSLKAKHGVGRQQDDHLFSWVPVNGFKVDASLLLDQLSSVFTLLITGVGSLIHIYSIGYMEHDPGRRRFFGQLNLFLASMLLLVLADGYLLLYVGWEGVGLASYLLIAFWYDRPSAATAAKKAFIMNRVGDVGLSLAIMMMFATLGTTSFAGVFGAAHSLNHAQVTAIGLLLLLGACGKSGQFPLQTWLPDAMEGPTPVSALIHAATMVTAGVYLIARSGPIFDLSQDARTGVTLVGCITLLYGCLCGTSYDDIKKVLAYSTVSQIGYMFLAVGLGPAGYAIGIMHLLAHGFFKAGLFLGAGSVMHGMGDRVDMRTYGGLAKLMPYTYVTFLLGYLAIIGFPGLSGFFTKDKIIEAAFDKGGTSGWIYGIAALLGAGLTAFYMTRLMCMTFWGKRRWEPTDHPHDPPTNMVGPMVLLAIGSVLSGFLFVLGASLQHWLQPVVGKSVEEGAHTINPGVLTALTLVVVAGGAGSAWLYFGRRSIPRLAPVAVSPFTFAARRALLADALNETVIATPGTWLMRAATWADSRGIDNAVNGIAAGIGGFSGRLRRVQTGFVRSYALSIVGGTGLTLLLLLVIRAG